MHPLPVLLSRPNVSHFLSLDKITSSIILCPLMLHFISPLSRLWLRLCFQIAFADHITLAWYPHPLNLNPKQDLKITRVISNPHLLNLNLWQWGPAEGPYIFRSSPNHFIHSHLEYMTSDYGFTFNGLSLCLHVEFCILSLDGQYSGSLLSQGIWTFILSKEEMVSNLFYNITG